MQGRLTLHVRRLVHISQVSSVFLKGQCQCSCTDILTNLLIPCRYGKCFQRYWRYISLCSFNNNQFIDSLTAGAGSCCFCFSLFKQFFPLLVIGHIPCKLRIEPRTVICLQKVCELVCNDIFRRRQRIFHKMNVERKYLL